MKHLPIHKRLLCLLLCLSAIIATALPVCAQPSLPSMIDAAPVYYRASSSSTIIGYMPQRSEVTVLGQQGQYYRIDCYDMAGFMHEDFIVEENEKYYVNLSTDNAGTEHFTEYSIGRGIVMQRQMHTYALAQVGVPYVSGGTSPRGFDCSGFTQYIYAQLGFSIPRTCDGQLGSGLIIPKEKLQCGDLVLFQRTTSHRGISTHVGIYLGDGKLIHAGSRGITVVELNSAYFTQHYLCARRVIVSERPSITIPSVVSSFHAGAGFPEAFP